MTFRLLDDNPGLFNDCPWWLHLISELLALAHEFSNRSSGYCFSGLLDANLLLPNDSPGLFNVISMLRKAG